MASQYMAWTVDLSGSEYVFRVPLSNYAATVAPSVTDDEGSGFAAGSIWDDLIGQVTYKCFDSTIGAAVWLPLGGSGSGITQLTGDVTAGPGSGSQVATVIAPNMTVASFTIPALTSTVTLTPNKIPAWLVNGMTLFIQDGANAIYGTSSAMAGPTFDFTTDAVVMGSAGSTMAAGAICTSAGEEFYGRGTLGEVVTSNGPGAPASFQPSASNMTIAAFTIPALTSTVTLTPNILQPWLVNGMTLAIQDSINAIYGTVSAISGANFDFTTGTISTGSAGSTMAAGAICTSAVDLTKSLSMVTASSFTIPAISSTVSVALVSSPPAWLVNNMTVFIQDGLHSMYGEISALSGSTFTLTTDAITLGIAGNTMAAGAIITSAGQSGGGGGGGITMGAAALGGTNNGTLYIDGSGNIASGATGSATQVWTSNGSSSAPTMQSLPGPTAATAGATTGTISLAVTTDNVTIVPSGPCTFNATSVPSAGKRFTMQITTSGTTSRTLTFGTAFISQGTLATGTVSGKRFSVSFDSDGTNWQETGRTAAM